MDFLDSLKQIRKELEKEQRIELGKSGSVSSKGMSSKKNTENSVQAKQKRVNCDPISKELQEVFLKEEKLRDEFENFIKDSDIKKIF